MTTLIYPGAGWDNEFLDHFEYDRYILIDALPKVKHYEPGQVGYPFQESFFETLENQFGEHLRHDQERQIIYFDRGVEYWYSQDANALLSQLPRGDLFIRGYHPEAWNIPSWSEGVFVGCDHAYRYSNAEVVHIQDCFCDYASDNDSDTDCISDCDSGNESENED